VYLALGVYEQHRGFKRHGEWYVYLDEPDAAADAIVDASVRMVDAIQDAARTPPDATVRTASDPERDVLMARVEGLPGTLDAAQSEVSFLRDGLGRGEEQAERELELVTQEREALHARLHEALAALALVRALPSPTTDVETRAPEVPTPTHSPWWRRWWRRKAVAP